MDSETTLRRLGIGDLDEATDMLSAAFAGEPPSTHLFHGPAHDDATRYFLRCSAAYALRYGEAYATAAGDAIALWLLPGKTAMTPGRMFRAGMFAAPFRMGLTSFRRFAGFASHTDAMHRAAVAVPHYYLFALAVVPSAQGRGAGSRLMQPILRRADAEGRPVFLETQKPRNVRLYRRHGFEVAAEAPFPGLDGLVNVAMVRPAKTAA